MLYIYRENIIPWPFPHSTQGEESENKKKDFQRAPTYWRRKHGHHQECPWKNCNEEKLEEEKTKIVKEYVKKKKARGRGGRGRGRGGRIITNPKL